MVTMAFSQRLFGKPKSSSKGDASSKLLESTTERLTSTASDTTVESEVPIHVHVNILSENNLVKLWKELKSGMYNSLKSLKFSFNVDPSKDISKMKHINDVFAALGSLSHLEDVVFCNATLFMPTVHKLLKKASALRTLKFHHCNFVLGTKKDRKDLSQSMEKLWEGIQQQGNLAVLEILVCTYVPYQTMSHDSTSEPFTYQVPQLLQEHKLPKLRRLVLDQCILDCSKQSAFVKLLTHNASLQELEIQPVFETSSVRRQQYQAKKRGVRKFLLETIPSTLKTANNSKLTKLVVAIDDYFLNPVYKEVLAKWVDLVELDNKVLTELRATHEPLSTATKEADSIFGLETDAWLHCNLHYHLRLNELAAQGQVLPQDIDDKAKVLADILPDAYDVSCLHQLLQPNPDIMDASTQSVPNFDINMDDLRASLHSGSFHASSTRRGSLF